MRTLIIMLLLPVALLYSNASGAQENSLSIGGIVTDEDTVTPIPEHWVHVEIFTDASMQQIELFTNSQGIFQADSVEVQGTAWVTAQTHDCMGAMILLQDSASTGSSGLWFEFAICSDSNQGCDAFYNYDLASGANLEIQFENLSTGSYEDLLWEFGDESTSMVANPVHLYSYPGVYIACISIWNSDSTCLDQYCQEVIVPGDSLDCWNFFSYETWDLENYTFNGESYPDPADYYYWDFGDGTTGTGQTVFHSYGPSSPDTVTVTLTTHAYNPSTGDTCSATSLQTFVPGNPVTECENWYSFDSNDNLTFEFTGFSDPEASEYLWNFGDGQTGMGESIIHIYENGYDEPLPVTLTTVHILTSGDTCFANSMQWIMPGGSECIADFIYEADSENILQFLFFNSSTGPATDYFWDFGDGELSVVPNPVHEFMAPGVYTVCLTIESDSLGFFCSDTYCLEIPVDFSLTAGFTAVLDTLSGNDGTFFFTDSSQGDPDSWLWNFGDGQQSQDQHPVHQYEESGVYEVCLKVSRSFPGLEDFEDEYCQSVESPLFFDLGGQVYLDNIPMNNFNGDTTVVDMGMACLYQHYENTLIPADTQYFAQFGYYWFSKVRAGNYILRIKLTPDSEHYGEFLPGYHQDAISWQDAQPIALINDNLYDAEVSLQSLPDIQSGGGSISGYVVYSGSNTPLLADLEGIDVYLLDQNQIPMGFSVTDEGGDFSFQGIPSGTYSLISETPGMYSSPVIIQIEDPEGGINDIALHIYEEVLGISPNETEFLSVGQVFPNPVEDRLRIDISAIKSGEVNFSIYTITGQQLLAETGKILENMDPYSINVREIPSGIYILTITLPAENEIHIRKFIK